MSIDPKAIFATPGILKLDGREYVVQPPSPTDVMCVHERMTELAGEAMTSPLAYVSANRELLDPATFEVAVRAAVAMGAGGGSEPTPESVSRQYRSLEGIRWRVWYAIKKSDPTFTQEQAAKLVTEENRFEIMTALDRALGLEKLEKKVPTSGAS
jgi:hypothetical protein